MAIGSIVQWALSVPLYIVLGLLVSYYARLPMRKDHAASSSGSRCRFPMASPCSKLFVALVVAPLPLTVLAIATYLVFDAIDDGASRPTTFRT